VRAIKIRLKNPIRMLYDEYSLDSVLRKDLNLVLFGIATAVFSVVVVWGVMWALIFGALFVLFGGALQGTLVALAVLLTKGRIEEPEAVREERRALQEAIAAAEGEERAALERELAEDPIGAEPGEGFGQARLAFGPFLVLACLELLLFQEPIQTILHELLWVVE